MSKNDPVYGNQRYESKCKVSFKFECLAKDVTKCRFWSGTTSRCIHQELNPLSYKKKDGTKPIINCTLKYAGKWAIIKKLKDYYSHDIIKEIKKLEQK